MPPIAWAAALALTAAAFWAVGQYDAVLHRYFETGVDARGARIAGVSAIAVSQTIWLGMVTGAILRWRMLPNQSRGQATRITVAVALSFLAGWAVVTAAAVLAFDTGGYAGFAWAMLGGAVWAIWGKTHFPWRGLRKLPKTGRACMRGARFSHGAV